MRINIDAYNQVAQLYNSQNTYTTTSKVNETATKNSDQLSISQSGYSHQIAKTAVSEASDLREDKIAKIKARIQAGTYHVSTEDLANKFLENYNVLV